MRLDKYLKVAQVLKRRTISNQLAKQGQVMINDKLAKPASEVKIGDLLTIRFASRTLVIRVLDIAVTKGKNQNLMYEIVQNQSELL